MRPTATQTCSIDPDWASRHGNTPHPVCGRPFDELKGSWVEIVGHFDDPVAEKCTSVLNENVDPAPYPAPDPDLTVFRCRLNFVVTELTAATPPSS